MQGNGWSMVDVEFLPLLLEEKMSASFAAKVGL